MLELRQLTTFFCIYLFTHDENGQIWRENYDVTRDDDDVTRVDDDVAGRRAAREARYPPPGARWGRKGGQIIGYLLSD